MAQKRSKRSAINEQLRGSSKRTSIPVSDVSSSHDAYVDQIEQDANRIRVERQKDKQFVRVKITSLGKLLLLFVLVTITVVSVSVYQYVDHQQKVEKKKGGW